MSPIADAWKTASNRIERSIIGWSILPVVRVHRETVTHHRLGVLAVRALLAGRRDDRVEAIAQDLL
jgi:hypothetical protein